MMNRPVYLDLFRLRLPLPGWVSILHRLSGALLFVALPLAVWLLAASLSGPPGFAAVAGLLRHPAAKLVGLLFAWSFAQHFFAGLRHLMMDAHHGVTLAAARRSSAVVLGASALATLVFAAWVFA
jgi:succinate dehydrogenase / fumarate reductase cytochrome b subunit